VVRTDLCASTSRCCCRSGRTRWSAPVLHPGRAAGTWADPSSARSRTACWRSTTSWSCPRTSRSPRRHLRAPSRSCLGASELPALPRGRWRRGQYDGLCEVVCGEAGGLAEWWVLANYWESW